MKKLDEVKIYGLQDAVKRLRNTRPADGGEPKGYSYGGIFSATKRRWPDLRPVPHGIYAFVEDVTKADAVMEGRERGGRCKNLPYETRSIGSVTVVGLAEYAKHYGLSLSAIRKVYYADNSPLRPYFFEWSGGYALSKEQLDDLVGWLRQYGRLPRASKFKRSLSHRKGRAPLKTHITGLAMKTQPEEGKEPV